MQDAGEWNVTVIITIGESRGLWGAPGDEKRARILLADLGGDAAAYRAIHEIQPEARVGYAIGPKSLISAFDKLRNHFGLSRISQAGALAALKDQAYVEGIKQKVAKSRETLAQIAQDNGLIALPSATNFVTIDCGRDGDFARAVLEQMIARAVFIRMPFVAPMNRCIRISCGDEAAMDLVAKALPEAMKAARSA